MSDKPVKPDSKYSMRVLIYTQKQIMDALGLKTHPVNHNYAIYCDGNNKVRIEIW